MPQPEPDSPPQPEPEPSQVPAPPAPPTQPDPEPDPGAVQKVDEAPAAELAVLALSNQLSFDLYRSLRERPGNLVFSPASVGVALAIALGGARGETAAELARVLYVKPGQTDAAHRRFGTALRVWTATDTATLRVAARVFVERSAPIEAGFLALTRDRYGAPALGLDFIGDPEAARSTINRWVAARTENRIRELVGAGALNRLTRLVLANAVYFKGTWQTRFDPARTHDRSFHLTPDESVRVPTMIMTSKLAWARHPDGLRILETPYAGGQLSMIWLLPEAHDGLPALEAKVNAAALDRWRAALKKVDVFVALPRFRLEPPAVRLKDALTALGMRLAFKESADFTGMARLPDGLFVSEVYHQAFLEVNEEGTEAAAATAMVMATMSADRKPGPEPPSFIADHPFLFVLMDRRTGLALFVGRVVDPR
jgi:serpin B